MWGGDLLCNLCVCDVTKAAPKLQACNKTAVESNPVYPRTWSKIVSLSWQPLYTTFSHGCTPYASGCEYVREGDVGCVEALIVLTADSYNVLTRVDAVCQRLRCSGWCICRGGLIVVCGVTPALASCTFQSRLRSKAAGAFKQQLQRLARSAATWSPWHSAKPSTAAQLHASKLCTLQ